MNASSHHPLLLRAQGYLDLGMCAEAWAELRTLPGPDQDTADALHVRVSILIKQRLWHEALALSLRLCDLQPMAVGGFIQAAYCLHEMGQTRGACDLLRSGPPSLLQEAIYHYNLSCYLVHLGEIGEARHLLGKSFELDERLVGIADSDPDLAPLWATL